MALFTIQSDFRYEIVRKIFEGGMGVVYEGEQHGARDFIKRVAIKIIRPSFASQKMFIENFIGEAKLVADLIHTNIVQTYHLGEANNVCFIAMELIRGVNLEQFSRQLTDKKKVLPKELAVFITSRVARGLAYAHAKTDKNGKLILINLPAEMYGMDVDHPKYRPPIASPMQDRYIRTKFSPRSTNVVNLVLEPKGATFIGSPE